MLKQLYIKNFTLIDTLDVHFNSGFSVITGETGAGKSIILGAINLLLGQRADAKSIKSGCKKCVIEAHFDLSRYNLNDFFLQNGLDFDEEDCILRRELNATGKSRAFINDMPVALNLLRDLGRQLIDIHSQHQNLLLNEEDFQLDVIDTIAKDKQLFNDYSEAFGSYKDAKEAVRKLKVEIEENRKNEDYLRFQFNELTGADLMEGMQEQLEKESDKLSHTEEIKEALFSADRLLNSTDVGNSSLDNIKDATRSIENILKIYPDVTPTSERLYSCFIELQDISQDISRQIDGIDFDPERLDQITSQLDKIYSLEKKYHVATVEELISIRKDIEGKLSCIDDSGENLDELEQTERKRYEDSKRQAQLLTVSRCRAAKVVEREMKERLIALGMPNVRFSVQIEQKDLGFSGQDRVTFLFSANKSTAMQPINQVASGGEIARVMLALKAMISGAVNMPTIIFDEIDTGVSGKIAEKMSDIMLEMAKSNRQVISITHLPQIASKGQTHYKVYKEETANGTVSIMKELRPAERVKEIAQMLSGSEVSDAAIHNAKELLNVK